MINIGQNRNALPAILVAIASACGAAELLPLVYDVSLRDPSSK
jgi:hypothetical protein